MNLDSDLFRDAELYDAQYGTLTKDLRFYRNLALQRGGPVLELGVGTGRVGVEILKSGIALVGIDRSQPMLQKARQVFQPYEGKWKLLHGDFLDWSIDRKFPLVIAPFHSLQHVFGNKEMVGLFQKISQHLEDDGLFVFDLPHFRPESLSANISPFLREIFFDEERNQRCEVWENATYDSKQQVKTSLWKYLWNDGATREVEMKVRVFFPEEWPLLMEAAGLRLQHCYGDFDRASFSPVSPKQILVCEPSR